MFCVAAEYFAGCAHTLFPCLHSPCHPNECLLQIAALTSRLSVFQGRSGLQSRHASDSKQLGHGLIIDVPVIHGSVFCVKRLSVKTETELFTLMEMSVGRLFAGFPD